VVAILEIGAFVSSLLVGRIGDLIGRRRTILYGSMVFFIGGALQAFATSITLMMVGRIIAGLGVGALSTIVPVYQSEISVRYSPSLPRRALDLQGISLSIGCADRYYSLPTIEASWLA
jgi:Arabinose efflux permease